MKGNKEVRKLFFLIVAIVSILVLLSIVQGKSAQALDRNDFTPYWYNNYPTHTPTPTKTPTPTNTPTNTPTPSNSPTPTNTPTPTRTPTPTPTKTPTPTPTNTLTPTPTSSVSQGCTPGYWKQPHHFDSWVATGYSPNQTLESVFDIPNSFGIDNDSLATALSYHGGSTTKAAAQILLRAGVAALLNSADPDINYSLTTAQVISQINAALASNNRATILSLATQLDQYNNRGGCPLN